MGEQRSDIKNHKEEETVIFQVNGLSLQPLFLKFCFTKKND